MQRLIPSAFLAASLVCDACGESGVSTSGAGADGTATAGPETSGDPQTPVEVCGSRVFAGRVGPGHTCVDHGGWSGAALGETGILREFCEYTWQGDGEPELADLPGEDDGVLGLIESCPRVVPHADPFAALPALREELYAAFMLSIGQRLPLLFAKDGQPLLYIVDTIPESLQAAGLQPNDAHGLRLRELTLGILCGELGAATCPVRVNNVLGLPRVTPEHVDYERGGYYGSLMDLARGVDEAVRDWEKQGDAAPMVLALALGWEPLGTYDQSLAVKTLDELLAPGSGVPTDVQAVVAALARALCHDALLVAAVGNATGEPCAQTGAVGPALFEALLKAPTIEQCEAAGFSHEKLANDNFQFLMSVSHVGLGGQAAANARTGAVGTLKPQGSTFSTVKGTTALLTGSSVATTVTAAAAYALWAVHPALSRTEVLESLKASDGPTGVNICRALQHACKHSGGGECGALECPEASAVDDALQKAVVVMHEAI